MDFHNGHFTTTEDVFSELCEDMAGFCLACGEQYGDSIEPDARGVECESCNKKRVYGAEELLLMGRISFE
jgi:DNA-directed RNA polymerase subunit RPC12/RpoP